MKIIITVLLLLGALYAQNRVFVNEQQKSDLGITSYTLQTAKLAKVGPFNGIIVAPSNATIALSAQVEGTVASISVEKFEDVQKGSILFSLSSQYFIALQEQYLELFLNYKTAVENFGRDSKLYQEGIIAYKRVALSKQKLQQSTLAMEAMEHKLILAGFDPKKIEQIKKSLKPLKSLEIIASEAGSVEEIYVDRGENVTLGTPLAKMALKKQHLIEFSLPRHYRELVHHNSVCSFADTKALIRSISQSVQSDTQSYAIRASIEEEQKLPLGSLHEVYLHLESSTFLELPKSALVFSEDQAYIFKEIEGGYEGVKVAVIQESSDRYIIEGALRAGEKIAANATIALLSAMEQGDE